MVGKDGHIEACLCWQSKKEIVNIWYFKVFDSKADSRILFNELVTRIPETTTLLMCIVDEYALPEQLAFKAAGFECEPLNRSTYKFSREP